MIVVDTSVWVEATRRPAGTASRTLQAFLDAEAVALALPVRLELLAGIRKQDRAAFVRGLSGLPLLIPTEDTWRLVARWIPSAADRGRRFSVTDLLIAGLAAEIGALVWSRDKDFDQMESLDLVGCYEPA